MVRHVATALGSLALFAIGCGRDPGPAVTADASTSQPAGIPTTGAGGGPALTAEAPLAASALVTHEAAVRAALADGAAVPAPGRTLQAPLIHVGLTLDDAARRYTGEVTVTLLNATDRPQAEVTFALPANLGATGGRDPRTVTLDRVTVAGRLVDPTGTASLLHVPLDLAPNAATAITLSFAGTLPELAAPTFGVGPEDLETAAGLAAVDPPGAPTIGHRDGLFLLARAYPQLTPPGVPLGLAATAADVGWLPVAHHTLDVTAGPDLLLAATGREVASERLADGRRRTRFAAPATREVALVASRAFAPQTERVGPVTLATYARPAGLDAARAATTAARRALETYEAALGPYPGDRLTLAEAPLANAAAIAYPGLIVVNSLFFAPPTPTDAGEPLLAVLTRHPARREGLAFAVQHAVAHEWWGQLVASDAVRAPWLPEALASVAALGVFSAAGDDKAARHQRELLLALPFQLGRLTGGLDAPVRAPSGNRQAPDVLAAIRHGKAALWLDATRRAMSDTLYHEALRAVLADHAQGVLDDATLLERLVAAAPRPDVVRDLARRWLDEAHGDEDIGALHPDVLLEYVVGDAAVDGGARELLGLLANNRQFKRLLDGLLGGDGGPPTLDGARLVGTLAQLLGEDAPPALKRWLDVLGPLAGGGPPSSWGPEVLTRLTASLGLGEDEQALVTGAARVLLRLLEAPDLPAADDNASPAPP